MIFLLLIILLIENVSAKTAALFITKSTDKIHDVRNATSYKQFIAKSVYIIDNTELLEQVLLSSPNVKVIVVPGQFGKSTVLRMFKEFLEIEVYDDGQIIRNVKHRKNYKLFNFGEVEYDGKTETLEKPLSIKNFNVVMEKQGTLPVIYLDMSSFAECDSFPQILNEIRRRIGDVFRQHRYLHKAFDENMSQSALKFEQYCSPNLTKPITQSEVKEGLIRLSNELFNYFKKRVYVLVDEFDSILNALLLNRNLNETEKEEIRTFLADFYSTILENNANLEGALICGVVPFPQGLGSGIDRPSVHTVLNSELMEYFGVDSKNSERILRKRELIWSEKNLIRMFKGYVFGERKQFKLLNPFPISEFFRKDGEIEPFWVNAASNMEKIFKDFMKLLTFKQAVIELLHGNCLHVHGDLESEYVNHLQSTFDRVYSINDQLEDDPSDNFVTCVALRHLMNHGYLTQCDTEANTYNTKIIDQKIILENSKVEDNFYKPRPPNPITFRIPNLEIETRIGSIFQDYLEKMNWLVIEPFDAFQQEYVRFVGEFRSIDGDNLQNLLREYLKSLPDFSNGTSPVANESSIFMNEHGIEMILGYVAIPINSTYKSGEVPGTNRTRGNILYSWHDKGRITMVEVKFDVKNEDEHTINLKQLLRDAMDLAKKKEHSRIKAMKTILIEITMDKEVGIFSNIYSANEVRKNRYVPSSKWFI